MLTVFDDITGEKQSRVQEKHANTGLNETDRGSLDLLYWTYWLRIYWIRIYWIYWISSAAAAAWFPDL